MLIPSERIFNSNSNCEPSIQGIRRILLSSHNNRVLMVGGWGREVGGLVCFNNQGYIFYLQWVRYWHLNLRSALSLKFSLGRVWFPKILKNIFSRKILSFLRLHRRVFFLFSEFFFFTKKLNTMERFFF